jgi:hypothetical protein
MDGRPPGPGCHGHGVLDCARSSLHSLAAHPLIMSLTISADRLQVLAADPSAAKALELWRAIDAPVRTSVLVDAMTAMKEIRMQLVAAIASGPGGFRAQVVSGWAKDKIAGEITRRRLDPSHLEENFLIQYYVHTRPEHQNALFGALTITGDLPDEPVPVGSIDAQRAAARTLPAASADIREAVLYAVTIVRFEPLRWPGVKAWLAEDAPALLASA